MGVVGDVHCESTTLSRVLDALETMSLDRVLCVGDLVDGPGDAEETLRILESRAVQCVAGNHERWFLGSIKRDMDHATVSVGAESERFLRELPRIRRYDTPAGPLMLCHGVGEDDEAWLGPDTRGYALQDISTLRELMLDESVAFMVGGHTHQRMVRVFPGLTVINAGTLHRKDEQTFTVLDFDAMTAQFYSAHEADNGLLLEELEVPTPPEPEDE